MKRKSIIAGIIAAMLWLYPSGGLAQEDIEIYVPEQGQTLIVGQSYRIRLRVDAAAQSYLVGAVFARPEEGMDSAFARMKQTELITRQVGNGEACYSLQLTADGSFGVERDGEYRLWVFAIRPDKTVVASGYLALSVRSAPETTREGWFTDGGLKYFGRDGRLLTGWQEFGLYPILTRRYYFDESGAMCRGWIKSDNKWHYLGEDGLMLTGWLQSKVESYYLDPLDGHMYTHWNRIDGVWYSFHPESGRLQTGWQGGYYLSDGRMLTGWQRLADAQGVTRWYYFQPPIGNESGFREVDGARYYEYPDGGKQLFGWQQITPLSGQGGAQWHYLYEDGGFASGWQQIGGSTYCFDSEGAMQTGWIRQDSGTYYLNPISGVMLTGVQTIDGKKYDFGTDGKLR